MSDAPALRKSVLEQPLGQRTVTVAPVGTERMTNLSSVVARASSTRCGT